MVSPYLNVVAWAICPPVLVIENRALRIENEKQSKAFFQLPVSNFQQSLLLWELFPFFVV
jgi:hypothetical protein